MVTTPDTRRSLILRLRERDDAAAWEEFISVYRPMMIQMGKRRGMQDADIQDTIQQVLMSVAAAIVRWSPDAQGRFRSWLTRIFQNQVIDHFRKAGRRAAPQSELVNHIADQDAADGLREEIHAEYRRVLFHQVALETKSRVESATWEAFWRTAVDGEPPAQVGAELGMSVGAVYAARSRMMARIRETIQKREAIDEV